MLLGTGDALGDALRFALRWTHAVATAAWVGGSLFYLVASRPALRSSGAGPEVEGAIAGRCALGRLSPSRLMLTLGLLVVLLAVVLRQVFEAGLRGA